MMKSILLTTIGWIVVSFGCGQSNQFDRTEFSKRADDFMEALVNRTEFSGTVLVAYQGEIIFNKGYGLASRRFDIPNDEFTKFRTGSIGKSFTAVLILQCIEQGLLSLDDYLKSYIPEYPFADQIQIKHLLSHTSGIKRDIKFPNKTDVWSLDELIEFSKVDSLLYEPGTKMTYSNCGYILLHRILEMATKKDYETLVNEKILQPLGMEETGIEHPLTPPLKLADGFALGMDGNGYTSTAEQFLISHQYSDAVGAIYSTPRDLLKFINQIGQPGLLSEETWVKATTPFNKEGRRHRWGFGFNTIEMKSRKFINHNGRTTGFRGGYFSDKDNKLDIIILANHADAEREVIAHTFLKIMEGNKYYQPKVIKRYTSETGLEQFTGIYETDSFEFEMQLIGDKLYVVSHGDPPTETVQVDENTFYCKYFDLNLYFQNKDGSIIGCEWEYRGSKTLAKRK